MNNLYHYRNKNSILYTMNAKNKIIFFLVAIILFSAIKSYYSMILMVILTLVLSIMAKISLISLLKSIKSGAKLVLFTSMFILIFSKGTPLFQIEQLIITVEGLSRFIIINMRFICIFTLVFILFSTTPILVVLETLRLMKIPDIIVDIIFFSYRYIYEIDKDMQLMRQAMFTRGYNPRKWKSIIEITYLFGNLLVRSFEQSTRIYNSMILRGYGLKNKVGDEN
ncbi:MAG: energy-coupling factor transporter transmembrane protein EcfT [Vallitalea sp.]|nr:energy-coupling factor transporter transmembrane protein EcfT [Vallitalea sp.]